MKPCCVATIKEIDKWLAEGAVACLTDPEEDEKGLFRRLKAICELAFFEFCVTPFSSQKMTDFLTIELNKMMENGRLLRQLRLNPDHANLYLPLICATISSGSMNENQYNDLRTLVEMLERYSKEKLPFRQIDIYHSLWQLTGEEKYKNKMLDLAHFGCLGGINTPFDISISDEYAITHTVFYLTDFGRISWPENICSHNILDNILNILSAKSQHENNCDLIAEYALCRLFTRSSSENLQVEIQLLKDNLEPAGFCPGPLDLKEVLAEDNLGTTEQEFLQNYHTTLLAREAILRFENIGKINHIASSQLLTFKATEKQNEYISKQIKRPESNLHKYFDCLRTNQEISSGISQFLSEDYFLNPSTILSAVEYCYWRNKFHLSISGQITTLNDILEKSPLNDFNNSRYIRIWILTFLLLKTNFKSYLIEEIAQLSYKECQNINFYSEHLNDCEIDRLVTLQLTIQIVSNDKNRIKYQNFIRFALDALAINLDVNAFFSLIACGIDYLQIPKQHLKDLHSQFLTMRPNSLGFGWATSENIKHFSYVELESIKSVQSDISFHQALKQFETRC